MSIFCFILTHDANPGLNMVAPKVPHDPGSASLEEILTGLPQNINPTNMKHLSFSNFRGFPARIAKNGYQERCNARQSRNLTRHAETKI